MSIFFIFNRFLTSFLFFTLPIYCESDIDPKKSLTWGPGLNPAAVVLPARYFFVQLVTANGKNATSYEENNLKVDIGHPAKKQQCRVWTNVLNRNDGSFIVRYKLYQICTGLEINVRYRNVAIAGFPRTIHEKILPDECICPKNLKQWKEDWECPGSYYQLTTDLKQFKSVDMGVIRDQIKAKFNKRGSQSLCQYIVSSNNVYRKCYGQHIGFHVFMDAMLLSLARKVILPDLEFFVNLGDWPLEKKSADPLPIFSWCGSKENADIVMPTYDLTESTLENMGRVQLDMLSVQGNSGPGWKDKIHKAFWRGRDSRKERLDLVDIARAHPNLFNVSLTNFFFFRDKEKEYGPKQPHVSFYKFFDYKYQICIDGTVAAYRFPYLLAGGSLVFKQDSPYYEHFYRDLRPNEHYIPVNRNLSNLVEKIRWAIENDEVSLKIATKGASYARENLLPTGIFCYHVLLFEEWSKKLLGSVEVLEEMEPVLQQSNNNEGACGCGHSHNEL